jgi:hypothetical protein
MREALSGISVRSHAGRWQIPKKIERAIEKSIGKCFVTSRAFVFTVKGGGTSFSGMVSPSPLRELWKGIVRREE